MQRSAMGLVLQVHRHAEEIAALFGKAAVLSLPRNADDRSLPPAMARDRRGVLSGQLWEQTELPARTSGKLLLNFCNLAPILSSTSLTMIHDTQVFTSPQSYTPAFAQFYRFVQPILGARALRVLTVSQHSADQLVQWNVARAERIRVIPNGIDHAPTGPSDPSILARLGLNGTRYVLALSSAQAHKNLGTLLAAFGAEELADLVLVLFGVAGPEDLREAGYVLPPNVRFAGRLSDGALRALTEAALCYAMPSRTEGFGLPPLEAMLRGCPAVVSTGGALPEVCGDAALYADPDRPADWIAAIRAVADDAAVRMRYAAIGRERAGLFTWDRAGEALMGVLREVADDRSGKAIAGPLERDAP